MNLFDFISPKNDFFSELKDLISKQKSYNLAKNLHWNTSLHFAGYEDGYARCIECTKKEMYYIPKNKIKGSTLELGTPIKIESPGIFYSDTSGIPLSDKEINELISVCKLVN